MVKFEPLASSSAGNAYKLSAEGCKPLLLDCGIPFKKLLKALDFKLSEIAGCLITHAHGDHCASAKDLMDNAVDCYATRAAFEQMGVSHRHKAKAIDPDLLFMVDKWKIHAFKCVHDAEGTVGYFLAPPMSDHRIVYMTDTAYSRYTFAEVTHLYIECNHSTELMRGNVLTGSMDRGRYSRTRNNHMSLETLLSFLGEIDKTKLEEVVLLHLSDSNSDEAAFKKAVQEKAGCRVYVAGSGGGMS